MNGIYILDGQKIISGEKTSIPTPTERELEGEHVLLVKTNTGPVAAGIISIGLPIRVSMQEFDADVKSHCIPRVDRLRWWPTSSELFLYPVTQFLEFNVPVQVELPPGVKMKVDITRSRNVVLCTVLSDGCTCGVPISEKENHGA